LYHFFGIINQKRKKFENWKKIKFQIFLLFLFIALKDPGSGPGIRIRIKMKPWIRIRIKAYAHPQHGLWVCLSVPPLPLPPSAL